MLVMETQTPGGRRAFMRLCVRYRTDRAGGISYRSTMPSFACEACDAGPEGIGGHHDLSRDHHAHGRSEYECTSCGTRFSRRYDGNSVFAWSRVGEAKPLAPCPGPK